MGKQQQHVLVIPFPAQGHVAPLMKLSLRIASYGVKVTFVNTEFIHAKIIAAMPEKAEEHSRINLVSISDGMDPKDDRKDSFKLTESIVGVMPGHLQDLIKKTNRSNADEKITCVIADMSVWWALEVAEKMGIRKAAFCPVGLGCLAMWLHAPKLIEAGIVHSDGTPAKDEKVSLSTEIPSWDTTTFPWSCPGDLEIQKIFFGFVKPVVQAVKICDWLLCNSFKELESSAFKLLPKTLPIGPLLTSDHFSANFWPEDSTCLSWLDSQRVGSVIYVAFGSIAVFSPEQSNEIACGLELTGRPFLWVIRSDSTLKEFPDGFMKRVADRGKIVNWAPQEKVLAHPSVACFLSHCGWNSTVEGLSNGVPFLCWPYFADQFHNKSYICDAWKIGLGLNPDENGTVTRHEIRNKIERLISDDGFKANALKIKEMVRKSVGKGGSSFKNFESFMQQMYQ